MMGVVLLDNFHCQQEAEIKVIQNNVKAIFKRLDEQMTLAKNVADLVAEVRVMGESLKHTIKLQEAQTKTMEKMEGRMERIEGEMRKNTEDMRMYSDQRDKDIEKRLKAIEGADGTVWKNIKEKATTAIVAAIIGAAGTLVVVLVKTALG